MVNKEKIRMRDLIILLPGITGSILQKDNCDLWAPSSSAALRMLFTLGSRFELMRMTSDDYLIDDLEDGIKATGLIQDVSIIPGFFKIDGYSKISEMLTGCFDVIKASSEEAVNDHTPANFFEFSYDWRRDNRVAARHLGWLIDRRLEQWRRCCNPKAKVILLAHSMGGLIARYYLEALGGWDKCKALITFGTPHRGSLNALNYLANGRKTFFIDLTNLMRSLTSIYQLLPTYQAIRFGDSFYNVAELDIPGVDNARAREALSFHREIMGCIKTHKEDPRYLRDGYVNIPVVGTYQPTLQSAELYKSKLTVGDILPDSADELLWHGDGTVPYLSAVPYEMSKAHRNIFYAECHGTLQSNDHVLDFIYDQLSDMQVEGMENFLGSTRRPIKRMAISMSLKDLYWVDEPFSVTARLLDDGQDIQDMDYFREHMGAVVATVTPSGQQGLPTIRELIQEGTKWRLVLEGLTPGCYHIEVGTARRGEQSPHSVHDHFMIGARAA